MNFKCQSRIAKQALCVLAQHTHSSAMLRCDAFVQPQWSLGGQSSWNQWKCNRCCTCCTVCCTAVMHNLSMFSNVSAMQVHHKCCLFTACWLSSGAVLLQWYSLQTKAFLCWSTTQYGKICLRMQFFKSSTEISQSPACHVSDNVESYCSNCRNYYLMIIFFALATLYSFLDIQRQQAATSKTSKAANKPVNGLGYFVVTLFHINLTVWLAYCALTAAGSGLIMMLCFADCVYSWCPDMGSALAYAEG